MNNEGSGELMVLLQCKIVNDTQLAQMKDLLQYVGDTFPQITSLLYVINNKCNDTIGDLDVSFFGTIAKWTQSISKEWPVAVTEL